MRVRKSATGSVKLIVSPSFPVRPPRQKPAGMVKRESSSRELKFCAARRMCLDGQSLPARLDDAGDLSLERQTTEAQAADAELAQVCAGASAELAAVMLPALELGLAGVLDSFCSGCHIFCLVLISIPLCGRAERHAELLEQRA